MNHKYTPEQVDFLRENAEGRHYRELADIFNERFGTSLTRSQIKGAGLFYNIKNIIPPKRYTPEQIEYVKENLPGRTLKQMADIFNERFGTSLTREEIKYFVNHYKFHSGFYMRKYTLEQIEFLKATMPKFTYLEGTAIFNERFGTSFSVEQIKNCAHYFKFRSIKVHSVNGEFKSGNKILAKASTGKWVAKQRLVWEREYGPIPKNHVVIFLDGNNLNFAPENLLLVPRNEWGYMQRKGLFYNSPEITKSAYFLTKLKMLAKKRVKNRRRRNES